MSKELKKYIKYKEIDKLKKFNRNFNYSHEMEGDKHAAWHKAYCVLKGD